MSAGNAAAKRNPHLPDGLLVHPTSALVVRKLIAAIEGIGCALGARLFLRHAVIVTHAHPDVWRVAPLHLAAFGLCVVGALLL